MRQMTEREMQIRLDMLIYGNAYLLDGNRIDPDRVCKVTSQQTDLETAHVPKETTADERESTAETA